MLLVEGSCLVFHCARPTRGGCDRALREHRRSSGSIPRFLSKTPEVLAWVTSVSNGLVFFKIL